MLDPETGVGAYQISGGASGGEVVLDHNLIGTLSLTDTFLYLSGVFSEKLVSIGLAAYSTFQMYDLILNGSCIGSVAEIFTLLVLVSLIFFIVLLPFFLAALTFIQMAIYQAIVGGISLFLAEDLEASCG